MTSSNTLPQQRVRLGRLFKRHNEYHYYRATFSHLSHTKNGKVDLLLLNVYLVDKNNHLIHFKSNDPDDFHDQKGRIMVADHLWITATKKWLTGMEKIYGDQVFFKAKIYKYHKHVDHVDAQREQLFKQAQAKKQLLYQKYTASVKKLKHVRHRTTFSKNRQRLLDKLHRQQKAIDKKLKKDQSKIEFCDYSLINICNIHTRPVKPKFHFLREEYQAKKYHNEKYKSWLCYRSMDYAIKSDPIAYAKYNNQN